MSGRGAGAGVAGRYALVTGAASGMGRATAAMLAAEGAHVALCDLRSSQEVVDEIAAAAAADPAATETGAAATAHGRAKSFLFDARDARSITGMAARVLA